MERVGGSALARQAHERAPRHIEFGERLFDRRDARVGQFARSRAIAFETPQRINSYGPPFSSAR